MGELCSKGYNRSNLTGIERHCVNRLTTYLAEKFIDLIYSSPPGIRTHNPFRLFDPSAEWMSACPEEFFAVSADPPIMAQKTFRLGKLGTLARFTFPSPVTSPDPANNSVHGVADLRPDGQAKAALIFVHGHKMNSFLPLELFARRVIRDEFDVYYLTLPYHMRRAPRGMWSGQPSLNSNIEGTAMTFMQGVRDLRSLITWIECERRIPVVLAGVSLGAYTCCMATVVDSRPKAVVSILGGGSLARIPWDGYQMGQVRRQLQAGGVTIAELERYWKLLSPEYWKSKLDREHILLVAGKFDPIVTPPNTLRLWQAWGEPELHWFPCGHVTASIYYEAIGQALQRFLDRAILNAEDLKPS